MDSVRVAAKVNLSLKITGKRDGLHTLDMHVCSINLFDKVTLVPKSRKEEILSDPACTVIGEGDFAFRSPMAVFSPHKFLPRLESTYYKIKKYYGDADGFFLIDKGIPPCAGMGGSSAVAAGITHILADKTGKEPTSDFLLSLGSDVPYMYMGGEARVFGCGEIVEPLPFKERHIIAVYATGGVDTTTAYGLYDKGVQGTGDSDLFAAACEINPGVLEARRLLIDAGSPNAILSGSGGAVCAFFEKQEDAMEVFSAIPSSFSAELLRTVPVFSALNS